MSSAPHDPPFNPYEAPQTRELSASALSANSPSLPARKFPLPRSTERWLQAALWVYIASFVVPDYVLNNHWTPFVGIFYGVFGAINCWHPLFFAWWANVWFFLGIRKSFQARTKPATIFAVLGVITAAGQLTWWIIPHVGLERMELLTTDPPYLCWLAAMVLLLVAVIDLRRHESRRQFMELRAE